MLTVNQYTLFEYLFEYYNHALFQGQLKQYFIGIKQRKGVLGFVSPERAYAQKEHVYAMNLNPHGEGKNEKKSN